MTFDHLLAAFAAARFDHPGRRGLVTPRRNSAKRDPKAQRFANSKYSRRKRVK